METYKDLPLLLFASPAGWQEWLEENHARYPGAWLKFAKKASPVPSITYEEARDLAIAYGWIDGQLNAFDENHSLRRFTPRKPKSNWSKINREIAEALIANEAMRPSGLAHIEAAKQDGRWDRAYDSQSTIRVPEDFQEALDRSPIAAEFFSQLSSANRYAFLYRIQTARTTPIRTDRISKFVAMLEAGKVFHP